MIRIFQPYIEGTGDVFLKCRIVDEKQQLDEVVWYRTDDVYGKYLTSEVADAFVVGMLLPAVYYEENIVVDGYLSERLYYNIQNSVIYALSTALNKRSRISLTAKDTIKTNYNSTAVGCGCSLGVDSFAAMLQHFAPECPSSFKITHLTYFNVGAMGYVDLDRAKASYEKDLRMVKEFAKLYGLPVVCLESNFSICFKDFDFDASGHLRNFSAALSLQKLFGKYLYGSSFTLKEFRFDAERTGYYESILASYLSTDNTEIVIANPDMSRVDKTKYIVSNPLAQKYLYVCWKELIANKHPDSEIAKIKDNKLNCSRCDKCLRTLLAIDLLGELDKYKEIFDIPYYLSVKSSYIAKVLVNHENSAFYTELGDLMKEVGYVIPINVKMNVFISKRFPLLKRIISHFIHVIRNRK